MKATKKAQRQVLDEILTTMSVEEVEQLFDSQPDADALWRSLDKHIRWKERKALRTARRAEYERRSTRPVLSI